MESKVDKRRGPRLDPTKRELAHLWAKEMRRYRHGPKTREEADKHVLSVLERLESEDE